MLRSLSLVAMFLLTGCVAHIPLAKQVPPIEYVAAEPLVVSVVDDRERVRNGKAKTFVGIAHGTFGIPFDWHVKQVLAVEKGDKERDLAQFLQFRLARGLADKGWSAVELPLTAVPSDEEAQQLLAEHGGGTLLLLTLNEWFFSLNLNWVSAFNFDTDTEVKVYRTGRGKALEKRFAGRDVIDEAASQSPQNHILMAYRDQLAEILNDPEVRQALVGVAPSEGPDVARTAEREEGRAAEAPPPTGGAANP